MYFLKSNNKKISYGFFGFSAFSFTIFLISLFVTLGDLINTKDVFSDELFSILITSWVLQFLFALGVISLISYAIFKLYKETPKVNIFNQVIYVITLFISTIGLVNLIEYIRMGSELRRYVPGTYLAIIILSFLNIIPALITRILPTEKENIKILVSEIFMFLTFIITIMMLCTNCDAKASGFDIFVNVLFLFIPIIGAVTLLSFKFNGEPTQIIESNKKPHFAQRNTNQKLKELKELLDLGIISEKEYNEKRQKYINEL